MLGSRRRSGCGCGGTFQANPRQNTSSNPDTPKGAPPASPSARGRPTPVVPIRAPAHFVRLCALVRVAAHPPPLLRSLRTRSRRVRLFPTASMASSRPEARPSNPSQSLEWRRQRGVCACAATPRRARHASSSGARRRARMGVCGEAATSGASKAPSQSPRCPRNDQRADRNARDHECVSPPFECSLQRTAQTTQRTASRRTRSEALKKGAARMGVLCGRADRLESLKLSPRQTYGSSG